MGIIFNDVAIDPYSREVFFNDAAQNKVIFNDVQVWERIKETVIMSGPAWVNNLGARYVDGPDPMNNFGYTNGQGYTWLSSMNSFGFGLQYGWVDMTNINVLRLYWDSLSAQYRGNGGNPDAYVQLYVCNTGSFVPDVYGQPTVGVVRGTSSLVISGDVKQLTVHHPSGSIATDVSALTGPHVVVAYVRGYYMNNFTGRITQIVGQL